MSDLERVFSQPANDLDFSQLLNEGKILILNLSKGVLGDEPSRLLGGLLVSAIQQAALARASMPEHERTPFYLYVDEFQNFTVASFESILSESAKYQLNLTLANQTLGQLSSSLERSIFGNCGTLVSFQVSAGDAPKLKKEMYARRVVVRPKESTDFYRLSEWIDGQLRYVRHALTQSNYGLTRREVKSLFNNPGSGLLGLASRELERGKILAPIKADLLQKLEVLESEYPDLTALKELYPETEFRDHSFPEENDFLNIPPHFCFVRIGSAANVTGIRCLEPEESNPELRNKVLESVFHRRAPQPAPPAVTKSTPEEPESFLE